MGAPPTEPAASQPALEAIYYQSETDPTGQVWRLDLDRATRTQVSYEPEAVVTFAPSPAGDFLALSTSSSLVLHTVESVPNSGSPGARRVIASGLERSPGTPAWSADGTRLAYSDQGVQVYDLTSGQSSLLVADRRSPDIRYRPLAWSPRGGQLLMEAAASEGSSQLLIAGWPGGEITPLQPPPGQNAPACCQAAWAVDSPSLWIANANPMPGLAPGLWRYDPVTGQGLPAFPSDGSDPALLAQSAAWPHALPTGDLLFLYARVETGYQGLLPFIPARLNAQDSSRIEVLLNNNFAVKEFIWHPTGEWGVAVLAPPGQPGGMRGGPVLLIPLDGRAPTPLLESAFNLRWGP